MKLSNNLMVFVTKLILDTLYRGSVYANVELKPKRSRVYPISIQWSELSIQPYRKKILLEFKICFALITNLLNLNSTYYRVFKTSE